jgi:glyoxylase-like metal-dependent hydrolase (beta-lactamase superfamily II)
LASAQEGEIAYEYRDLVHLAGGEMMSEFPVIALRDGSMTFTPTTIFPTSTAQEWTRHQRLLSRDGALVMPFGGYLVRGTNDRLVLIDAGGGPEYTVPAGRGRVTQTGRLPQSLRAAGRDPEEVSDVVFTHLHLDHVGWASRHARPFFPNATYWCHQHDWDYFLPATGPAPQLPVPSLLEPVRDQLRTWTGSTTTLAGLELWHTPGHTPGSSIVMVPRGRGQLAIIGDLARSGDRGSVRSGTTWMRRLHPARIGHRSDRSANERPRLPCTGP